MQTAQRRALWWTCVLAPWMLIAPASAQDAQHATTALELRAPASCMARDALIERVEQQLGRPPFVAPQSAELFVSVTIDALADGYFEARLELRLRSTGEVLGTRGLRSDERDCASLDEPLAIILAMLLNVQRDELALPGPRSPWQARITARGGLGLGLLPGPALEGELEVGATLRDVISLAIAAGYGWSDTVAAAEGSLFVHGGTLRIVVAPIALSDDVVEISVPLMVGLGLAWGEASGFAASRAQTVAYFDVGVGARLAVALAPVLALELGADVRAIPLPPAFWVRNGDGTLEPLFQALPVAGSFHIGLTLRLE